VAPAPEGIADGEAEMNVLLIDGDDDLVRRLRHLLEPQGVRVIVAADGLTGVEAAHAERPDLILIDSDLARLSGLEAVRIIKAVRSLAEIPVVMMTAAADPETIKEAVDVGVVDFLLKPSLRDGSGAERILKRLRP